MAARGINKVILIGNTTQEPDCRFMPNGNQVTSILIATNESWTDKTTGEKKEKAEFHRVVFFGKLAEIVGQYVHKGSKLYVEGRLQTRKWTDQQGTERYSTEVIVDMQGTMQLLDSKQDNQQQPQNANQASYQAQQPSQQSAPRQYDDFDDDPIPF